LPLSSSISHKVQLNFRLIRIFKQAAIFRRTVTPFFLTVNQFDRHLSQRTLRLWSATKQ
jgi:hypothetical protein